jgi:hypothetical protein
MNKSLSVLTITILIVLVLSSCGIPKEKYETVIAERDTTQAQLTSANDELSATKTELSETEGKLTVTKEQVKKLEDELDSVKTQLQTTMNSLANSDKQISEQKKAMSKAKVLADINATLFVPIMKGEVLTEAEYTRIGANFITIVSASGDYELKQLFQAWIDSDFADEPLYDLFIYTFTELQVILN